MIYLFFSGGSGNRGCEAIVRGTKELLLDREMVLFSANTQEDKESKLDDIIECKELTTAKRGLKKAFSHLICSISYHFGNCKGQVKQLYSTFLKEVKENDTCFIIGGDVYCYDKPTIYYRINEILHHNKRILWGCSIEPQSIDEEMKKDLMSYDLIYARESITYNGLISHGIKNNVVLYPDPAFVMNYVECDLPNGFEKGNTIGINLSPLVINSETESGITMKNYTCLIDHILNNTNSKIALIPHVIWKNSDDRTILTKIKENYSNEKRVILCEGLSAEKIKYIIGNCKILIAARTHASIAAYSMCVPTLVLGYSVKARGIAYDIFGEIDKYTIAVQSLKHEKDLLEKFKWLYENEENVRSYLENFIPKYIQKLEEVKDLITD